MSQPARSSLRGVLWLAAIILALTAFVVTYVPRLREAQNLRTEKYKGEEQERAEVTTNNVLRARAQALTNDPREVERAAREKLNLAKPGETVFRFDQGSSASPPRNP
jgi:cell division protein FtsB